MRVLINALPAVGAKTGIGHYISELVARLRERTGESEEVATFPGGWMRRAAGVWSRIRPWALRQGGHSPIAAGPPSRPGVRAQLLGLVRRHGRAVVQRAFGRAFARGNFSLYHEPNFIPLDCDARIVTTVADLSVLLRPEWHPADRVEHFERNFRAGLARCSHFLAISESARREMITTLGLRPDQVTRTYMGIRRGLRPLPPEVVRAGLEALDLPPRYLLYLGTLEPRKNVLTLLRAYCSLEDSLRSQYPLLLVGGWGWNAKELADYLERKGEGRGVLHLGYVAEEHLPLLYNGARALVYPSFYEGFGLPPVEMLACGGAVLTSTAEALVETVGGKAHLVEALDEDGWRQGLRRVLTDEEWWLGLRRGAEEVARAFTWERCAEDTLAVYRRLAA